jgi:mRNA interferase MazF
MKRPTVTFEQWAIVVVPFPFTDRAREMRRPAIVLSRPDAFGAPTGHSVLAMVTSAGHTPWPLDVKISDLSAAGLSAPSVIRMKLFTRDDRFVLRQVGTLGAVDQEAAKESLARLLG